MTISSIERTHQYTTRSVRRAHIWLERMIGEQTRVERNRQERLNARRWERADQFVDAKDRLDETD